MKHPKNWIGLAKNPSGWEGNLSCTPLRDDRVKFQLTIGLQPTQSQRSHQGGSRGWDSSTGRAPDSGPKGCELKSPQDQQDNFSSPELTLCADSYSVSVSTPHYRNGT